MQDLAKELFDWMANPSVWELMNACTSVEKTAGKWVATPAWAILEGYQAWQRQPAMLDRARYDYLYEVGARVRQMWKEHDV